MKWIEETFSTDVRKLNVFKSNAAKLQQNLADYSVLVWCVFVTKCLSNKTDNIKIENFYQQGLLGEPVEVSEAPIIA